jgi:hypothetical protein
MSIGMLSLDAGKSKTWRMTRAARPQRDHHNKRRRATHPFTLRDIACGQLTVLLDHIATSIVIPAEGAGP